MMWAFVLIGAGGVAAGIVGIGLPAGERLGALLALVIGAGVGVAALAIGARGTSSDSAAETAFLIASSLGFVAVLLSSAVVWKRAVRRTPLPPSD